MKRIHFISQKDLIRIINLKDINLWNYIYNEHMKWLKNQTLKNNFYYVILELYKELNEYVVKYLDKKHSTSSVYKYWNACKIIMIYPRDIEGINKMFIKPKTKLSLEKFFNELGYKFLVSNHFGDGDSLSIHF